MTTSGCHMALHSSAGAPGQSKSEPTFRSAWEERERGRESSFAFERSGSIRAKGAAPEKGKSCSDFPFSGAPGGTRTRTHLCTRT